MSKKMTYDSMRKQRLKLTGLAKDMILTALKPIPIPLPILERTPDTIVYMLSDGGWEEIGNLEGTTKYESTT